MRKFFCMIGLAAGVIFAAGIAGADQGTQPAAARNEESILSMDDTVMETRLDRLERQVNNLEDQVRFLDERTRNLDRRVDDLRRRD